MPRLVAGLVSLGLVIGCLAKHICECSPIVLRSAVWGKAMCCCVLSVLVLVIPLGRICEFTKCSVVVCNIESTAG